MIDMTMANYANAHHNEVCDNRHNKKIADAYKRISRRKFVWECVAFVLMMVAMYLIYIGMWCMG